LLGDDCSCPLDCPLREVIPAFDRNCFGFHELSLEILRIYLGKCRCALSCAYALVSRSIGETPALQGQ
jgi:hypothetical protein